MMYETYKDKLLHYEVQPPEASWEMISGELEKNKDLLPVSKKMYDYQVTPPLQAWKNIIHALSKEKQTTDEPVISRKPRFIYKIMAAAAVLGIILTIGQYLTHINLFKNKIIQNRSHKPNNLEIKPETPSVGSAPVIDEPEFEEIPALAANYASKSRKNYKENFKDLQNTKVKNPLLPGNNQGIMIAAKPIRNAKGEVIQNTEIMNNNGNQYISITGPNGQQTKISSKFLHMLLFINDDSDIDEVDGYFDKNFLQSLIWKSRFQEWRNKIINTSLVPSSTNFMDILEFKDLITRE